MSQEIYILDLIGTFAFALYGSYFALRNNFDIFGIFVCAFLTAVGGGTIREVILGNIPFYFYDSNYIVVIFVAMVFTIYIFQKFHRIKRFARILDSIGLVAFAFIGASAAHNFGLGLFATAFLATISAIGGGMLRDMIMNKIPEVMYCDFYASTAVLMGVTYKLASNYMDNIIWANMLIIVCLAIRLVAVYYKFNLWRPFLHSDHVEHLIEKK